MCKNTVSRHMTTIQAGLLIGALLVLNTLTGDLIAKEPELGGPAIDAKSSDHRGSGAVPAELEPTPPFNKLDATSSDLNDALAAAPGTQDELKQAIELATLIANLDNELQVAVEEQHQLTAALGKALAAQSELEVDIDHARRQIAALSRDAKGSDVKITRLNDRLKRLAEQLNTENTAKQHIDARFQELQQKLDDTGHQAEQLRLEITTLTGELEAAQQQLDETNTYVTATRNARSVADAQRSRIRNQLTSMLRSVSLVNEPIGISRSKPGRHDPTSGVETSIGTYETLRPSNIRKRPTLHSERVGYAGIGEIVTVIGKAVERNWFEVETDNGIKGYISGDLIRPKL